MQNHQHKALALQVSQKQSRVWHYMLTFVHQDGQEKKKGRGDQQMLIARTFKQSIFNEIHTIHRLKTAQKA